MDIVWIRGICNNCLSFQSSAAADGGGGVGPLHSKWTKSKSYQNMIFGVYAVATDTVTRSRFPSPSVCSMSIHLSPSSSSSNFQHQPRSFKSARYCYSQFYQDELGFKVDKDQNFLPDHPILEEDQQKQVLHHSTPTQLNDIPQRGDVDASSFDFLRKAPFDTSSNSNTNINTSSQKKKKNTGGKEGEGKPTSEDDLKTISGIEEEVENLGLGLGLGLEMESRDRDRGPVLRRQRQMMERSTMIAKQVISIQSALTLGFVSQLWVDTTSWSVLIVEVRPNLLSGQLERFFLEDIAKVGDVLLIEDESVMENDFKLLGLETLVGYTVVTPGRRSIGKVRGYSFNINTGAVETLELDSFGVSIIPSSLVSTYGLLVEDVVEVSSDTVVVDEAAAASRLERLTKGLWDVMGGEYCEEVEEEEDGKRRRKSSSSSRNKLKKEKAAEAQQHWELPMDFTCDV